MEEQVIEEKRGVKFPYGFPSAANKHQIRLPPRSTKCQPADPMMAESVRAPQPLNPTQGTGIRFGQASDHFTTQTQTGIGPRTAYQSAARTYGQGLAPALGASMNFRQTFAPHPTIHMNFGQRFSPASAPPNHFGQQLPQAPGSSMKFPQGFSPGLAPSSPDFGQRMASVRSAPAPVKPSSSIASSGAPWTMDQPTIPAGRGRGLIRVPVDPRPTPQPGGEANKCVVCDRQRTSVNCLACGFWHPNLRVRIECPQHGKVHFLGDLIVCPRCHTPNLEEETQKTE